MKKRKNYNLSSKEIKRIIREFTTMTLIAAPIMAICYSLALTSTGMVIMTYLESVIKGKEKNKAQSVSESNLTDRDENNKIKQDNLIKKEKGNIIKDSSLFALKFTAFAIAYAPIIGVLAGYTAIKECVLGLIDEDWKHDPDHKYKYVFVESNLLKGIIYTYRAKEDPNEQKEKIIPQSHL